MSTSVFKVKVRVCWRDGPNWVVTQVAREYNKNTKGEREEEKKFENNRDFVHCQSSYESLSNFWIAHRANINFSFLTIFYAFIARTLGLNSLISTLDTLVSCELLLYLVVRLSLCISRIFGSTCYAIVMLLNQADLVFPVVQLLC